MRASKVEDVARKSLERNSNPETPLRASLDLLYRRRGDIIANNSLEISSSAYAYVRINQEGKFYRPCSHILRTIAMKCHLHVQINAKNQEKLNQEKTEGKLS